MIRLYEQLLDAWNRRDAKAFAALFADDGSAVGFDGSQMDDRSEIETTLAAIFKDHQTARYVARVREVRALGDGVTLLRAVAGLVPPGHSAVNPATNAVQSVVTIARDGVQKIALLQNTPAAFHGRPERADALTGELNEVNRAGRVVVE
jgi:uncharacterized protein (TIGR02246 family)